MRISVLVFVFFSWCSQAMAIKGFDYYYSVVLTWPASYCYQTTEGCCLPASGKPKLDFFVDKLLTVNVTTGGVITECNGPHLNIKELSGLIYELYGHWSSIKCPSREPSDKWRRVWNKYGVCSGLSPLAYFKKALAVRRYADLLFEFRKHGIVPSGENFYNVEHIKRVTKEKLGASVAVECSKNMWGESQLYRVYVCLDQDASTIISCPVVDAFNCDKEVTFGLFTDDMLPRMPRVIKKCSS